MYLLQENITFLSLIQGDVIIWNKFYQWYRTPTALSIALILIGCEDEQGKVLALESFPFVN
jgi:hypothetical protein